MTLERRPFLARVRSTQLIVGEVRCHTDAELVDWLRRRPQQAVSPAMDDAIDPHSSDPDEDASEDDKAGEQNR
jgi:hypothetical protein